MAPSIQPRPWHPGLALRLLKDQSLQPSSGNLGENHPGCRSWNGSSSWMTPALGDQPLRACVWDPQGELHDFASPEFRRWIGGARRPAWSWRGDGHGERRAMSKALSIARLSHSVVDRLETASPPFPPGP